MNGADILLRHDTLALWKLSPVLRSSSRIGINPCTLMRAADAADADVAAVDVVAALPQVLQAWA